MVEGRRGVDRIDSLLLFFFLTPWLFEQRRRRCRQASPTRAQSSQRQRQPSSLSLLSSFSACAPSSPRSRCSGSPRRALTYSPFPKVRKSSTSLSRRSIRYREREASRRARRIEVGNEDQQLGGRRRRSCARMEDAWVTSSLRQPTRKLLRDSFFAGLDLTTTSIVPA